MKTNSKKKILLIVLLVIVLLIGAIVAIFAVNASKNLKAMHAVIDAGLDTLDDHYTVTPCESTEYTDITMYGVMKFHTDQYRVEGLGNLSVMTTNMGMMQMVSFMVTPFEKQVPLCAMDFMYILGNRKSYVEFYDLVPDTTTAEYTAVLDTLRELQADYEGIDELPASENWYDSYLTVMMHKSLDRANDELNQQIFCDSLGRYLEASKELPANSPDDAAAQLAIIEEYSNGLIEKGGVSTDVFKKALGEDTTRDFFNKVFFGTDNYRAN